MELWDAYSKMEEQTGDEEIVPFSFENEKYTKEQYSCYLTYTTSKTHEIIRENLNKSSMYGAIDEKLGTGPRYCPSIEDKVVRFSEKERHQLFVEPESRYYDDIYLQGFSTSMPPEVQEKMVHSLPGFENAKILKYGYAIEYDAIYPPQLHASLETKVLENLFTAGQINGTSGYEEAACQGLMAGINACLKLEGKEPLVLKRSDAYIGVLIDDLITKGIRDPYRLLTSRAEFRLLLRSDNADLRLRRKGYEVGLISEEQISRLNKKEEEIASLLEYMKQTKLKVTDTVRQAFVDNNYQVLLSRDPQSPDLTIKYKHFLYMLLYDIHMCHFLHLTYLYKLMLYHLLQPPNPYKLIPYLTFSQFHSHQHLQSVSRKSHYFHFLTSP